MTAGDNGRADVPPRSPGITLVLGGGGARGLAHFGVIKVFEEEGIRFERLIGNSAGALAAAVYLQSPDAAAAIAKTLRYLTSPHFQRLKLAFRMPRKPGEKPPPTPLSRLLSGWRRQVAMHLLFRRPSLFHVRRLEGVVDGLVDRARIEDLRLPLGVVAVDLEKGEEVMLHTGDLGPALLASCSVAGFFPPVEIDGRVLIDAGHTDNLPIQLARNETAAPVVAVNLSSEIEQRRDFGTGIEIMLRAEEIGSRWNADLRAKEADIVLTPRLDARYWLDFGDPELAVAAGEEAARAVLPALRHRLAPWAPPRDGAGSRLLDPSEPAC